MARRRPVFEEPPLVAADPSSLREALADRGQALRSIRGDSMVPTLMDGDLVRVVPARRPRRGQVLVFEDAAGRVVVHRAVSVTPMTVVSRGDNRDRCDDAVPADAVIGRVVEVIGGPPIVDGGLRWIALEARLLARRTLHLRWRLRRLGDEITLLFAQARGGAVWRGPLSDGGTVGCLPGTPILRGGDVDLKGDIAQGKASGAEGPVVVPAGVYCRLSPRARSRLLAGLDGLQTVVFAYERPARGVLLRSLVLLRQWARRRGRDWGVPGDAVMGDGSGATVHLYRAAELEAELASRLDAVTVTRTGDPFFLLRGETARPAHQADAEAPATAR